VHKNTPDIWNANFFKESPIFQPIIPAHQDSTIKSKNWPSLIAYNHCLSNSVSNENNKNISFVKQATQYPTFVEEYEPRIFLSGEVQTRLNNWHDFFQVLVWKTFPKTKSLLNKIHFDAAVLRQKTNDTQRTKQENFVTLFDECGSIVVATENKTLKMVKNFEWNRFFVENKIQFGKTIDCIVFGHAMYEKALSPYIGMTSHCLLLPVNLNFFKLSTDEKNHHIDKLISEHIRKISDLNTKNLNPLPILGIPGWHKEQTTDFYQNKTYFRPGRRKKK